MFIFTSKKKTEDVEPEEPKNEDRLKLNPKEQFEKMVKDSGLDLIQYPIYLNKKVIDKPCVGVYQENGKYQLYAVDKNGKFDEKETVHDEAEAYNLLQYWAGETICKYHGLSKHMQPRSVFLSCDDFIKCYKQISGIGQLHVDYEIDDLNDFYLEDDFNYLKQDPKLLLEAKYFFFYRDFMPNPYTTRVGKFTAETLHSRFRDAYGWQYVRYLTSFKTMVTLVNHPELADKLDTLIDRLYEIRHHPEKHDIDEDDKVLAELNKIKEYQYE